MEAQDAAFERQVDILRGVTELIQERLPKGWVLDWTSESRGFPDVRMRITSPDGRGVNLEGEVRRSIVPSRAAQAASQFRGYEDSGPQPTLPIIIARYLPRATQEWLRGAGIAYADVTGNIWIAVETPALFMRDVGAANDPWRGAGRPRGSLLGEPPARVVRSLVDFRPPLSVPQLIKLSGASTGATYRVVDYLAEQMLIRREERGPIEEVDWRRLLEQWAVEYSFQDTNEVGTYLQPRGLEAVISKLPEVQDLRYAVTGSWAAQSWAPYAPTRSLMIYADDSVALANRLGLRRTETGANVVIANSRYDVVYERATTSNGVTVTSVSQTAVDLLTGPGRNPAEGQALLDWMESNEDEWRTPVPGRTDLFWTS